MSRIHFIEVKSKELIAQVVSLADPIWREHYTPIIGEAQVDYMLAIFQSPSAIQKQITENSCYYYLLQIKGGIFIGYLGFTLLSQELFLSKIYLFREHRGVGYAKEVMSFLAEYAQKQKCSKITLTVNKKNLNTIKAYEKMGFSKIEAMVQDIGNGFVMDDYKMEKFLTS